MILRKVFINLIVIQLSTDLRCQTRSVEDSDDDLGGELTPEDFANADNPQYARVSRGGELNNDTEDVFEGDIMLDSPRQGSVFEDVTTIKDRKWPKVNDLVTIPFTFPSSASKQDKADIARVVKEFERKTCIRLVKKEDELDWVHINTERFGCRSHLGRKGRKQQIIAGSCLHPDNGGSWGKLLHEWMHVLGFFHEHSRQDRSQFVTIHYDKINQSLAEDFLLPRFYNSTMENFRICANCTHYGPYDFSSVMHYPATMGIKNREIITVNDGRCEDCSIGQRDGLSAQDVSDIYEHYGCRISYKEHENLCQKKIDADNQMEEKRVRDDELRKVCPYVDCNILNARTLCPDQCIGKNSSEAGIWYHTPGAGEAFIITHTLTKEPTFCKVVPPRRISQSYVHLAYPANTVYPNVLSIDNGRIQLKRTNNNSCQVIVTDVKAVDNGEWKFSIRSEAILNGTVKTYRHKVEIIQKEKHFGEWNINGTCKRLFDNNQCGPGYQIESRSCKSGVNNTCLLSDSIRITTCHQYDCPKTTGEWINNGRCQCSEGKQTQTRTCRDGTSDKCSRIEIERKILCSEAGTSNQCGNRLLVIGGTNGNDLASTELITEDNHMDCNVPSYPIALYGHASSVTEDGIVSCGGHNGDYLNTCKRLTKSGSWLSFPSMKSKRGYFDMNMINGRLWAIGGAGGASNSMEFINPKNEDEWTKQSLPFSLNGHCLCELSGQRLIVTGGYDSGYLKSTWILDTNTRSWTRGPDMKKERGYHGCFSVKENGNVSNVYVFGGNPGPMSSTKVLNVNDLTWSDGPDLPIGIYGNAGVESNDNQYLGFSVGGYNSGSKNTIYGLQKSGDNLKWVTFQSMNEPRYYTSAVNVPSTLLSFC